MTLMPDPNEAIHERSNDAPSGPFLIHRHQPVRVTCGHYAFASLNPLREDLIARGVSVQCADATNTESQESSVLIFDARDMQGPEREFLLAAMRRALPAGPIVIGGADDRNILLKAINEWHAFRLLPRTFSLDAIADAITRAQWILELDTAVERCAHHLLVKCQTLAERVDELNTTQERLLHAERLATLGLTIGALMQPMQDQAVRLEGFRCALAQHLAAAASGDGGSPRLTELVTNLGEAQRCFSALVGDMLALAEDRPTELRLEQEELDPFIERTLRLFRYDPLAQERQICSALGSGSLVRADRNRLRHVILNLLRNAAQASTPSDTICVRTRNSGAEAVIEVADSGVGMSPDTLKHIFVPFFSTKGVSGMGLGLYLSRTTVESHGGMLECSSGEGQGSTFVIRLPIAE